MNHADLLRLAEEAGFAIADGRIALSSDEDDLGPKIPCHDEVIRLLDLLSQRHVEAQTQTRAVDRYIVLYAEAEELIAQIKERHEINYGIEPSEVDWGHVGTMSHFVEILQYALHSIPGRPT